MSRRVCRLEGKVSLLWRTTYLFGGGSRALGGEEHELDGGDLRLNVLQLRLQAGDGDADGDLSQQSKNLQFLNLKFLNLQH